MMKRREAVHGSKILTFCIFALAATVPLAMFAPRKTETISVDEYRDQAITDLAAEIAAGQLSSESLTRRYLSRIDKIDRSGPMLRSVLAINPNALADAIKLDSELRARRSRGPLHGVPLLLKDNIETADPLPTTAGSLALVDNYAGRDASIVTRLRAAGGVVLGKANLSEWSNMRSGDAVSGWSAVGGLTRNPYGLDRTACGSSTGSAVAVSANLVAGAIGTDTNGSLTCPASMNGIVALRPTIGLVSRARIIPVGSGQDSPGPMTRTVRDAALLLQVIAGTDPADPATAEADKNKANYSSLLSNDALRGARLGVMRFAMANYEGKVVAAFERTLAVLRAAGAEVVDIHEFAVPAELAPLAGQAILAEFKSEINAYLASTPATVTTRDLQALITFNRAWHTEELSQFGQQYFEYAMMSSGVDDPAYARTRARSKQIAGPEGIDRLLEQYGIEALIAPTSNRAGALELRTSARGPEASVGTLAAIAGYPHLTVPMDVIDDLPVGLSFIGTAWSDAKLLALGYAYEQLTHARQAPRFKPTIHQP